MTSTDAPFTNPAMGLGKLRAVLERSMYNDKPLLALKDGNVTERQRWSDFIINISYIMYAVTTPCHPDDRKDRIELTFYLLSLIGKYLPGMAGGFYKVHLPDVLDAFPDTLFNA